MTEHTETTAPADINLELLADDLRNASDEGVNDITFADNFDGTAARILAPLDDRTQGRPTMVSIDRHPSLSQVVVATVPVPAGEQRFAFAANADAIVEGLAGLGLTFRPLDDVAATYLGHDDDGLAVYHVPFDL